MRYYIFIFVLFILFLPHRGVSQSRSLAGIVTEKTSGEVIIGATVVVAKDSSELKQNHVRGSITNKFGFYSIPNVEPGTYLLSVRLIGYRHIIIPFEVKAGQELPRINIHLEIQDVHAKEVVVETEREPSPTNKISAVEVKPAFIQQLPAFGGEVDIFRALQLLPGVQSISELSSGLYVRGGSPDQNLTLLDGVIVYNPSHLGGFMSTFNSDAVRDIKLIKGAFPAEYGGRLSSVLDMTMREGSKEKITGTGGISLINSHVTVEGPINQDATFMFSGRRMYLDLIMDAAAAITKTAKNLLPTYYFYDMNGKVNYKLGESDRVYLSGYFGRDVFSTPATVIDQSFDVGWGNSTVNFRWAHIVSPDLFTNFSAIYTDYSFSSTLGQAIVVDSTASYFKSVSGVRDLMLRAEAQYYPHEDHNVKAGIEATEHRFQVDVSNNIAQFAQFNVAPSFQTSYDLSFYAQDEWKITPLLSSNIGSRLYYFQQGKYFRVEPRISLAYNLTEETLLKTAFSTGNQFLHLVSRSDIALPTDVWFPSTQVIKPSEAMQAVLGVETQLFDKQYLFSVEGYYKTMKNLLEYKDTASLSLGTPLESALTTGNGTAYGIEFFLNKQVGEFTGWIGYTLAWTTRLFPELNNGNPFPPTYDRRHDISIVLTYRIGEHWKFGATWMYGTGQAYTLSTGQYTITDPNTNISHSYSDYTQRNEHRLPPFHKLDLNFTNEFSWFGLPWEFSMNIYNAYNNRNVISEQFETRYLDRTTMQFVNKPVFRQISLFPFIPTFGLNFKF